MSTRTIRRSKCRNISKSRGSNKPYIMHKCAYGGVITKKLAKSTHRNLAPRAIDLPKHNTPYDREAQEIERSIIAIKNA